MEVWISDNASTDETEQVATLFGAQFPNLHYTRNAENIGTDRNVMHVAGLGRGKFLILHGDDDFFNEGTILPLLNVLHRQSDCSVVHVNVFHTDNNVVRCEGVRDFLRITSNRAVFMSACMLRRSDWE